MHQTETDKRKLDRADVHFLVAYGRPSENTLVDRDLSQTKNISEKGMLLTTRKPFDPETRLDLKLKLPINTEPVHLTAKVQESKEISPDLIYLTRLVFADVDEQIRKAIRQTVQYYVRKNTLKS